jgi:hypothetical protein
MWRDAVGEWWARLSGGERSEPEAPASIALDAVVDVPSLRAFFAAGNLRGRSALALPCRRYAGARFAHELALRPDAASLEALCLAEDRLGVHGARALAGSASLARLAWLDLSGNQLGDAGARALAESTELLQLTTLNLAGNGIGDAGACALAHSKLCAHLKVLRLSGNHLGPAGARALAESPALTQLEALDLSGNPLGDEGARALAAAPQLGATRIELRGNRIGAAGLGAIEDRNREPPAPATSGAQAASG